LAELPLAMPTSTQAPSTTRIGHGEEPRLTGWYSPSAGTSGNPPGTAGGARVNAHKVPPADAILPDLTVKLSSAREAVLPAPAQRMLEASWLTGTTRAPPRSRK
jgi:hypothetical protein